MFEGRCEIWIASIPEFTEHQAALDDVLTPDERAHVDRIREGRATARLSRGLLRLVLARYLNLPPAEIEIDRSCPDCGRSHGRPRLRDGPRRRCEAIEFSVTHGGDLLVLAFADSAPVGVDVEPIGALEDVGAELLDFTLTATERLRLLEVPAAQRRRIFLQSLDRQGGHPQGARHRPRRGTAGRNAPPVPDQGEGLRDAAWLTPGRPLDLRR